jgi:sugar fermentation stimulation protein A
MSSVRTPDRNAVRTHGILLRRYKRFLADIRLDNGEMITAHCPNTGSMKNCTPEGAEVWLSRSDNPKRKYAYTWEVIRTGRGDYIGINTGQANTLVEEGMRRGLVTEASGYREIRREVRYGQENSRIDFFLSGHPEQEDCYLEVKSVTLLEEPSWRGIGYFPDAVSDRGAKHLRELMLVHANGKRAVLLYCVQHSGIREVRPADQIDPVYAELLRKANDEGVEIVAYKARYSGSGFRLNRSVPVNIPVNVPQDPS